MIEQRLRGVCQCGATSLLGQAVDLAEADRHREIELRRPTGLQERHELLQDQQTVERRGAAVRRGLEQPEHAVTRRDLTIEVSSGGAEAVRRIHRELARRIHERDTQLADLPADFHLPQR